MFIISVDSYDGVEILVCFSIYHQELLLIWTPEDTLPAFWSEQEPPLQEVNPECYN